MKQEEIILKAISDLTYNVIDLSKALSDTKLLCIENHKDIKKVQSRVDDLYERLWEMMFLDKNINRIAPKINDLSKDTVYLSKNIDDISKKLLDIKLLYFEYNKYINKVDKKINKISLKTGGLSKRSLNMSLCPCCRIRKADSEHHIIPRSSGGEDTIRNKIKLCRKCHDYVELKTDAFMKSGLSYNIDLLKIMIVNDAFNNYEGE